MSNVLGFLVTPLGSITLALVLAVLAPVLAWPANKILDSWGATAAPASGAGSAW